MSDAQCTSNCQSTQDQAVNYMQAEIIWSNIYMNAWTNPELFKELQDNADNANEVTVKWGARFTGLTEDQVRALIPAGVTFKIVFDTTAVVHFTVPAFQNIPPRTVDMVPHAL